MPLWTHANEITVFYFLNKRKSSYFIVHKTEPFYGQLKDIPWHRFNRAFYDVTDTENINPFRED